MHPEVLEVHDHLEVPYKFYREWVIRAKNFALVPLTPTNCCIGLLYMKNIKNLKFLSLLPHFSLFSTTNQVQLRSLVQFGVIGTRKCSKTTQRPQIPLVWYLWIENLTIRNKIRSAEFLKKLVFNYLQLTKLSQVPC